MFDDERHLVGADLQHRAGARRAFDRIAESGIEEAGVMDAELPDQRVVGDHLGGMVGRHGDRLARRQDMEVVGIEDDGAIGAGVDGLPEFRRVVMIRFVDVDEVGVLPGLVADELGSGIALEVDGKRHLAFGDVVRARVRVHQADFLVQPFQGGLADRRRAAPEPQLVEARALAGEDGEGPRRDFGIERPFIAGPDAVELGAMIGNQPGEHVEPPGRALGVGDAGIALR